MLAVGAGLQITEVASSLSQVRRTIAELWGEKVAQRKLLKTGGGAVMQGLYVAVCLMFHRRPCLKREKVLIIIITTGVLHSSAV